MVKWIVIGIIALIILGNLGVDIRKSVNSPITQSNLEYIKEVVSFVWNKYLEQPAKFIWKEVFIEYIWKPGVKLITGKVKEETSIIQHDAFS